MAYVYDAFKGDLYHRHKDQFSKTLTFNANGSLNTCTDFQGSETLVYTAGILSSVVGTGVYKNKTFSYSDTLDSVTV